MRILAVETATEACSAAICDEGTVIERYRLAPREHNQLILPMIEEVLAEAGYRLSQLDALAFGRGPGSFTGVRIAAGVAQGIALAADLPIVPVSTLAALAFDALASHSGVDWAMPCIDARMDEVYCAVYRRGPAGEPQLQGDERVLSPLELEPVDWPLSAGIGSGSGWGRYPEALRTGTGGTIATILPDRFPRAGAVARLGLMALQRGAGVGAAKALPHYVRDRVTQARPTPAPSPEADERPATEKP